MTLLISQKSSDLSFRLLARKYGCEVTFTEMCIAKYYLGELKGVSKTKKKYVYEFDETDRPLILQVAGDVEDADHIIEMVNLPIFKGKIDAVDINWSVFKKVLFPAHFSHFFKKKKADVPKDLP